MSTPAQDDVSLNMACAQWWEPLGNGWTCRVCNDRKVHSKKTLLRHERTNLHQQSVQHLRDREGVNSITGGISSTPSVGDQSMIGLQLLLDDMCTPTTTATAESGSYTPDSVLDDGGESAPISGFDDTTFQSSFDEMERSRLTHAIRTFLNDQDLSDDDVAERSESDHGGPTEEYCHSTNIQGANDGMQPGEWGRASVVDQGWFPWPNKIACTIDILMHLPRSVFSQRQVDILTWLLRINGVHGVPSVKSLKTLQGELQQVCGIKTLPYDGAFGHKYFVNSFADIIRQEMANPRVRSKLWFYPEDAGKRVSEARQAKRWLHEMDPTQLTPMVRLHAQDFFIFEPTLLSNGRACIPIRWFVRDGTIFAKAWVLRALVNETGSGWVVEEFNEIEISEHDLLVSFKNWGVSEATSALPPAHRILGVAKTLGDTNQIPLKLEAWTLTNPCDGNRWRVLASGARVYAFPIWLYCDDTSGNLSKRWNKHNSFLFTPAGLPRTEVHQEYNVHFLCTSNIAPPLEMLDGIVDQLETGQEAGIWAWDCVHKEQVLMLPSVLALLGDNPMQSEFACHIGLMGKFFCRICKAKGRDVQDAVADEESGNTPGNYESDDGQSSVHGDNIESADENKGRTRRKGKVLESMEQMMSRIKRFTMSGEPRQREDSITKLKSMFTLAKSVGNQSKIKAEKTATGLKDTYLDFFLDRMAASYKKKNGNHAKKEALEDCAKAMPLNVLSPVWRIKGLDPHRDTPVEILHTILLGFIKYFWRDVVNVRIGKDKKKRELLETRLSSLDTTGLGIPPLAGHTLVQYAGSLVGRDFRAITQVAPFVLHGLVPDECYNTWVALSKLVPLVWQPEIEDTDTHLLKLESMIQNFLAHTALWTPRWFNKPKFHILLHLTDHIRRFGPAALFVTEAFESFNAVIRAKSIHSNRQSPSRDISNLFAHGNRIRHILSGGYLHIRLDPQDTSLSSHLRHLMEASTSNTIRTTNAGVWRPTASAPLDLVHVDGSSVIAEYLGLDTPPDIPKNGSCEHDERPWRSYDKTETGQIHPNSISASPEILCGANFRTCKSAMLANGDRCSPGNWVLVGSSDGGVPTVARIKEIIQRKGSPAESAGKADAVLLQRGMLMPSIPPYFMPAVRRDDCFLLQPVEHLLCTINVQHRCDVHQCSSSGFQYVIEERQCTTRTRPVIVHQGDLDDMVLNTAKMRDAKHVQRLCDPFTPLDMSWSIEKGVASEIDGRKSVSRTLNNTRGASTARRGRGRGESSQYKRQSSLVAHSAATSSMPNLDRGVG